MAKAFLTGLFLCVFTVSAIAQLPAYTYYTIRDGLPSNDIYNCTEDKRGFLWIATENGLARFDGKNFKTYTTADGLPDNEVLDVQCEINGKLWVLPFQRNPAYYDERSDRFINSNTDAELKKVSFATVNRMNPLAAGGMAIYNSKGGIYLFKNGKCTSLQVPQTGRKQFPVLRIAGRDADNFISVSYDSLRSWRNNAPIGAAAFRRQCTFNAAANGYLYVSDSATLLKYRIHPNGAAELNAESVLPFVIASVNFTNAHIAVTSVSGDVYLADTASLGFSEQTFSFNSLIRFVYADRSGNTWICTKENGLIRYRAKGILTVSDPAFQRNFNSIAFHGNRIVAGTNDGRLISLKDFSDPQEIKLSGNKSYTTWVRRITSHKNVLFAAAEGALYIFSDGDKIVLPGKGTKDIFIVNDTLLLAGSANAIYFLDVRTNNTLDSQVLRVTALNAIDPDAIYAGSNSGLYRTSLRGRLHYLGERFPLLRNRVSSLTYNPVDKILWVGLANDTIVGLKNDKPFAVLPFAANLPGNICRSLWSKQKGVLWVGTNKALARINYSPTDNGAPFKFSVFTTADGLAGKQVNDIIARNDTVYAATSGGISLIPANITYRSAETPVFLTGIRINNRDTLLTDEIDLRHDQNNLVVAFAAIDLGLDADRVYEYRINTNSWSQTRTENISLQELGPGEYELQIRALNKDGSASSKIASLKFSIARPFWKIWWLYALASLLAVAILYRILQKRNRQREEAAVQKLLTEKKLSDFELQALKAQINPHFVFNCLNSIKLLNHKKQFAETDKYLDQFSFLLRNTLDYSGVQQISLSDEMEYNRTYLELEKLRLGNRLNYQINVKAISANEIFVPPMLLQPYLENAIKHGIRHLKNETGKIRIVAEQAEGGIKIEVIDNGVGISRAAALKSKLLPDHTSRGITLQDRRAALYGIIVNFKSDDAGTAVNLFVPEILRT